MSSFRIRPRFNETLDLPPEAVAEKFRVALEDTGCPCCGKVYLDTVVVEITEDEKHYWSPQLTLILEEHEGGTFIRGLYGPAPNVWAIFTYGYATIAILATFAASYGVSQVALKHNPWMLWTLPAFGLIGLALYLSSQMGQKLGAEQTFTLHHFYQKTIGKRTHVE